MTPEQLKMIWLSGGTLRWHAQSSAPLRHSQDSVSGHQCRCLQLLLALCPKVSLTLVSAVIHHDAGESAVGDMPGPTKRRWSTLRRYYDMAEEEGLIDMGIPKPKLTQEERDWLHMVDRLDAYLWVQDNDIYLTRTPSWEGHRVDVIDRARKLGCADAVVGLILTGD